MKTVAEIGAECPPAKDHRQPPGAGLGARGWGQCPSEAQEELPHPHLDMGLPAAEPGGRRPSRRWEWVVVLGNGSRRTRAQAQGEITVV